MWFHPYAPYTHSNVYHSRPDIRCTFSAMRQCDALFGRGSSRADECRAGARDAHLLDYGFGRGEAYGVGRSATLTCPPAWDESGHHYPRRRYYIHDCHRGSCGYV